MTEPYQIFANLLGHHAVSIDPMILEDYGRDRTRDFEPNPSLVVFPSSAEEVAAVMRVCAENGFSVVPSGGRTGYAGAAVAANREVVVSMDRMNRMLGVSDEDGCVETEAGAILQNVQQAVRDHRMMFPIDFASRGSCQIGGCISTNAGGLRVIRYGMMRESVMGLEVITPTGQRLDLHDRLHKNNSGYDLKQLFIGAEGTLGIVTRAVLRTVPVPRSPQVALLAVPEAETIVRILGELRRKSCDILAFEFFDHRSMDAVLAHIDGLRKPFTTPYPWFAVIEVDETRDVFMMKIEKLIEQSWIADALIADAPSEAARIWKYREAISESLFSLGHVHKNDVAVPISALPPFIRELSGAEKPDGAEVFLFGHLGDGNIHVNLVDRTNSPAFRSATSAWDEAMCRMVVPYRGTISAEHGIGLLKKHLLAYQRSPEQLALMRQVKRVLDPKGICNPGKMFDL